MDTSIRENDLDRSTLLCISVVHPPHIQFGPPSVCTSIYILRIQGDHQVTGNHSRIARIFLSFFRDRYQVRNRAKAMEQMWVAKLVPVLAQVRIVFACSQFDSSSLSILDHKIDISMPLMQSIDRHDTSHKVAQDSRSNRTEDSSYRSEI